MSYFTLEDVGNRALQHLGVPRISNLLTNQNRPARELNFALPMLRRAELQQSVWTFATKRCVMRPVTSTTKDIVFLAYSAATTYATGDVVKDANGFLWLSRKDTNLAKTPGREGYDPYWVAYFGPTVAPLHDVAVTYLTGDVVYVSTAAYLCILGHSNQLPPNTTYWRAITGATLAAIVNLSPIGYELDPTATQRTIYRLPANFLRMAPQDPKIAAGPRQNVTAGMSYNDWEVEEPYLFTATNTTAFIMRFVADQTVVPFMHPLFCETWAARAAIECAESLTQNQEKLAAASALYQRYTDRAQMLSAIEAGTTEDEPRMVQQQQGQGQGQGR